ncbi:protein kinase, putative, partial [Bodo saltans]
MFEILKSDIAKGDRVPDTTHIFYADMRGQEVVLKTKFDKDFHRPREEAALLSNLSHPSIVKCFGYCEAKPEAYVVLEKAIGPVTPEWLARTFKGRNGERARALEVISICLQVGAGLKYLCERKVLHRDIKPNNVLRFPDSTYKICDFDISKRT